MGKIAKGMLLLLASLVAFASPGFAASAAKAPAFAREYSETLPPIGFVEFCQRSPESCQPDGSRQRRISMPDEKWLLVRMVNAISTRTAREGDRVYMRTASPILVNGRFVVPVDSYAEGVVSRSVRSGGAILKWVL